MHSRIRYLVHSTFSCKAYTKTISCSKANSKTYTNSCEAYSQTNLKVCSETNTKTTPFPISTLTSSACS